MAKRTRKTNQAVKPRSVLQPQTKSSKITKASPSKASSSKASLAKSSSAEPSPDKASATAARSKRSYDGSVFGHNLPSPRLRFPESGNVTAIEQIVFLTETVRSHDPLNRLVQHGMDAKTFAFIVNQCRTFSKHPLSNNSSCILLQTTMRDWGHKDWTFGKHESGLFQCFQRDDDDLTFEEMEMDRGDSLQPKRKGIGKADDIPFEALAIDVTRLPVGDDALDLTCCVIWALNNPDSGLLYPRDFQWLTDQLGGAKPVLPANQDSQAFERWNKTRKAHKTLSMSASLAVTKAEAEYQEGKTEEERSAADKACADAKEKLAELNTAGKALVIVDKDTIILDQDRIPPLAEIGPDPKVIADYLGQYKASTITDSASTVGDHGSITSPPGYDQFGGPQDHGQKEDEELVKQSPPNLDNYSTAGVPEAEWRGEWTPSLKMPDGHQQECARPKIPTASHATMGTDSAMDYGPDVPIDSIETDDT